MMTSFLPTDYKIPKQNSGYMKIEAGENKFRILSRPIVGWEDWTTDKRPIRFPMDKKPLSPINPENPVKHFWAFIVWNYAQKSVQILEIIQTSIQKAISEYCNTPEWGAPFHYDIKVTRTGDNKNNTKYVVTALPHKPLSEDIVEAFHKKPINLEALYAGEDPFSLLQDHYTPGVFNRSSEIELQPIAHDVKRLDIATIDEDQLKELTEILPECSDEYKKKTWSLWKKKFGITKLGDLPASAFEEIKKDVHEHLYHAAKEGK